MMENKEELARIITAENVSGAAGLGSAGGLGTAAKGPVEIGPALWFAVPKSTHRPKPRSSGWRFVGVVDSEEMAVLLTRGSQAGFARGALVCMAE